MVPVLRIEHSAGRPSLRLGEIWRYRELLYFFAWRDIKVRYKQTALGAAWAIIQPVFTMIVFTIFFGRLARIASDGIPYPIFAFAALVPWTFFAHGLTESSNSLLASSNLIKKVYFPRLTIPMAGVLSGLVDLAIALLVLLAMMAFYRITPTANVVWLPCFVALALMTSLGVGFWMSAMSAQFRDVKYIVPFLTQVWLFLTPIAYPSSLVKDPWREVYALNPMVGVVEGFRWALLGARSAPGPMLAVSTCAAFLLLLSGAYRFRRMERGFADVL